MRYEPGDGQGLARRRSGLTLTLQVLGPSLVVGAFALCLLVWPRAWLFLLGEVTALALLGRLWALTGAGPLSQAIYEPLSGVQLTYRVEHLGLLFAITGVAMGLLLTLPWLARPLARTGRRGAWVLLAQFGMLSAVLAGDLESMAAGWAIAVGGLTLLCLLQRRVAPPIAMDGPASRFVAIQASTAVLLLAGAVAAETSAGTGAFDSIPVTAFDVRAVVLLAAAPVTALLTIQLLCRAIHRPLLAALAASSVLMPMSAYLLTRLYDLCGGRLPDSRVNAALVLVGGVTALGFALASVWAVDLGAAVARLGQAAAGLTLVAAGAGTGVAIAALELAPISLGLGLAALLAMVQAGGGRLPSTSGGRWSSVIVTAPALLAIAWAAGLPVGLATIERVASASAGVDAGGLLTPAAGPAILALPVMVLAAYGCGRFGGGQRPAPESRLRLALLAAALGASSLALGQLEPLIAGLAAAVVRVPSADLQSTLGSLVPGTQVSIGLTALTLVLVLAIGRMRGTAIDQGFPGAVESLPPRLAVAPGIYGIRFASAARRRGLTLAAIARRHAFLSGLVVSAAAAVAANAMVR